MYKSMIRIVCFAVILVCVLSGADHVLRLKNDDGIYSITKFYEQEEDSIDVLVLGSSHAFASFNTGVLWDECGMAAYILGGGMQPLWNTYYYLKAALKTQTPELIVLEGGMAVISDEYSDAAWIINNTYGLKWSRNKIDALKVSLPPEQWHDYQPEYVQYHTRYKEITASDFLKHKGSPYYENWKGSWDADKIMELDNPDVSGVSERKQLYEKTEEYYRKIIELAQENNIPIVVVISPYAGVSKDDQAQFNRAQDIAEEYGVEFINYNLCYQEIGIDYTTDARDSSHFNFNGNRKFSSAVGRYLAEHYEISDRRGDSRYQSWQNEADYIRAEREEQELREIIDGGRFLEKAHDGNYLFFISTDGECDIKNLNMQKILNTFGVSFDGTNQIWQVGVDGVEWYSGELEAEHYLRIDRHDICLKRNWNEEMNDFENKIIIDNSLYKKVDDGVNVSVYSTITQRVVDSVGFDADENYQMVR